jgi:hypothetical protein
VCILPFADIQYAAYVFVILAALRWLQYVAETSRSLKITFVQWLEIKLVYVRQLHGICVTLSDASC